MSGIVRIKDLDTESNLTSGDYLAIDSSADGLRKVPLKPIDDSINKPRSIDSYISNSTLYLYNVTQTGLYIMPNSLTIPDAPTGFYPRFLIVENFGGNYKRQYCGGLTSASSSYVLYHRIVDIRTHNYEWISLGASVALTTGSDFNDLTIKGSFALSSSATYQHSPLTGYAGMMFVHNTNGSFVLQIVFYPDINKVLFRRYTTAWGEWQDIGSPLMAILANNSNADNITDQGKYLLASSNNYYNMPETGVAAELCVDKSSSGYIIQSWFSPANGHYYIRSISNATPPVVGAWKESGQAITYDIDNIVNSYEVTASPQITTDNLYILTESDDNTQDRTADILAVLESNKICRLGAGTFVVKNLSLSDNCCIIGCGNKTIVQLSDDDDAEYCFRVQGSRVTIANMLINGNGNGREVATPANKDGILFMGTYDPQEGTVSNPPQFANIRDLIIRNFTGSAIKHIYTGTQTQASTRGSNISIYYCSVGLNINDRAEYNQYTNVMAIFNNVGLINNGGNNTFSNCDFSRNRIGVVMNGTSSANYNNGHGALVNCKINHNGQDNDGDGLVMTNVYNGFVIDGCQMFYGSIKITNSKGVNISNLNGNIPSIEVSNGGLVLLDKIVFANTPTVSITGNANVHFTNCYRDNGTAVTV